jgi:hypothetical protein
LIRDLASICGEPILQHVELGAFAPRSQTRFAMRSIARVSNVSAHLRSKSTSAPTAGSTPVARFRIHGVQRNSRAS